MLRSLRKAAQSLERGMETAFSTAPPSHTAHVNTTITIGSHRVRLGPVFAEGGFSFIHTASPVPGPPSAARFAVKRVSCRDADGAAHARREMLFLVALPPHRNIVRYHGAVLHHESAFLLFDLVDGGTLPEVLARLTAPLAPRARLDVLADAVAAVAHLHACDPPVAVRDVKLENLLYDRLERCYKLCDFGSVSTFAGRHVTRKEILAAEDDIANNCTPMYRAPEQVDLYSKQFICERVDVWALGCVWYALLFGKLPFDGLSSLQITKGLQHIPCDPTFPEPYLQLLKAMMTVSPADRPDSFTVLETIRNLQGGEIDPQLKRRGAELRAQRARDFESDGRSASNHQPGSTGGQSSNSMAFGKTPAPEPRSSAEPLEQEANLIDFAAFIDDADASKAERNIVQPVASSAKQKVGHPDFAAFPGNTEPKHTAVQNGDDWADFESAFGSGSGSGRPPAYASKPSQHRQTKSVSTEAGPMHNKTTSLIDFGDLHITTPAAMPPPSAPSRPSYRPKPAAARSAPDFSDLIDFS